MHPIRPRMDAARRWQRFRRTGLQLAMLGGAGWFAVLFLALRIAPLPSPLVREPPPRVTWWPGPGPEAASEQTETDPRILWSPAVFALPTPAGFSHPLRRHRAQLQPPVDITPPGAFYLSRSEPPSNTFLGGPVRLAPRTGTPVELPANGVFPPRDQARSPSRMVFPSGWESRLFSGIDLGYNRWTNQIWSAELDMQFDAAGVPISVLLSRSSGLPAVDRRLARSAFGWRLLDPDAPRSGRVAWWFSPPPPALVERASP